MRKCKCPSHISKGFPRASSFGIVAIISILIVDLLKKKFTNIFEKGVGTQPSVFGCLGVIRVGVQQ